MIALLAISVAIVHITHEVPCSQPCAYRVEIFDPTAPGMNMCSRSDHQAASSSAARLLGSPVHADIKKVVGGEVLTEIDLG